MPNRTFAVLVAMLAGCTTDSADDTAPTTPFTAAAALNLAHGSFIKIAALPGHRVLIVKTEAVRALASIDIADPAHPLVLQEIPVPSFFTSDIAVEGSYAYLAGDPGGLMIADASDPADLHIVGQWGAGSPGKGVAVQGGYAYVGMIGQTSWNKNLSVIDVIDPAHPVEVAATAFTHPPAGAEDEEFAWARCDHMIVVGDYLYVANGKTGLDIVRIVDPLQPTLVSNVPPPAGGSANDVRVADGIAYVATGEGKLQIVDVGDPTAPQVLGLHSGDAFDVRGVTGWSGFVSIMGYKRISGQDWHFLKILRIDGPATLTQIQEYVHPDPKSKGINNTFDFAIPSPAAWSPPMLILADNLFGVRVFGVGSFAAPDAPALLGSAFTFGEIRDGYVHGDTCFALYSPNSVLAAIDISDPLRPTLRGYLETRAGDAYNKDNLAGRGSTLYVASNLKTVIVDASNPDAPAVVAQLSLSGTGTKIKVSGTLLAVNYVDPAGLLRLRLYDIANPLSPLQQSDIALSADTWKVAGSMEIVGNAIYVTHRHNDGLRLYKVDIADPAQPQPLGVFTSGLIDLGPPGFTTMLNEFAVHGDRLYLARPLQIEVGQPNPNDLAVLNVADFPNVLVEGYVSVPWPMEGHELRMIDGRLFVVDLGGVLVFDLSNPAAPALVAQQGGGVFGVHQAYDLEVAGPYLMRPEIDRLTVIPAAEYLATP